jgi:transposase-like protein
MSVRTIFCRFCGAAGAHRYGTDRRRRQRYHCSHCQKVFLLRTRTMQSGSRLTKDQWQLAIRLFSTRAGCSGADMSRLLGINIKSGQRLNRLFRRLVSAVAPTSIPGASEWDESIMTRQWILGGVSRHTRQCFLQCIPNRSADTLIPAVEKATDTDALLMTDEWAGYLGLTNHWTVCHAREFVNPQAHFVHTNTMEGTWGHLKPLSWHIYRGFPISTLPEFLSEVMFRYNIRDYHTRISVLSALLARKTNSHLV